MRGQMDAPYSNGVWNTSCVLCIEYTLHYIVRVDLQEACSWLRWRPGAKMLCNARPAKRYRVRSRFPLTFQNSTFGPIIERHTLDIFFFRMVQVSLHESVLGRRVVTSTLYRSAFLPHEFAFERRGSSEFSTCNAGASSDQCSTPNAPTLRSQV